MKASLQQEATEDFFHSVPPGASAKLHHYGKKCC